MRYRPGWRQLPWGAGIPLVFSLSGLLRSDRSGMENAVAALLSLVVVGALVAYTRSFGVELRPDALVMRGLRTRVIPWRDIRWIGPAPMLGQKCVGVMDGTRLWRLRAPIHFPVLAPDPRFEEKARTIYDWWVEHRGADWTPPPYAWPR